jgi:hypothetical protein
MKVLLSIGIVLAALVVATGAFAAGGCPASAGSLQEYQRCLVQTPNGAVFRGTMADLDQDHRELLAAMERNSGVPPQVIPSYNPVGYGYYPSMYRVAPTLGNAFGFVSWSVVGAAAASRGNWAPYYWFSAGLPIYY